MKVCNLYGDGYYYIPGTQTCIKIGGFLRTEFDVHAAGSLAPYAAGANALQLRTEDNYVTRARGVITLDVREQTSYGTLRAYLAGGWQYTSDDAPTLSLPGAQSTPSSTTTTFTAGGNSNLYLLRAFIQWGGFTFGKTASFFDFFNTSKYTHQTNFLYQDFGGVGAFMYGYTQQLGNGIAANIALEDDSPFVKPIVDVNGTSIASLTTTQQFFELSAASGALESTNRNAGLLVPDIVASIRLDQAWGGAQIAGRLHDNRATYYLDPAAAPVVGTASHPNDKWGYAISGGIELNLPWAKGDSLAVQSQYCVGASFSCYNNSGTRLNDVAWNLYNPGKIGIGWVDDAYFTGVAGHDNSLQLPTMWNVFAAIQHYWVPEVRTSLYGGYASYKANSSDVDTLVCANTHMINANSAAANGPFFGPGCADWAAWTMGSRTIWNPVKNLDIGVEALYVAMSKSAFGGGTMTVNTPAANVVSIGATNIWSGIVRVQYNFYP